MSRWLTAAFCMLSALALTQFVTTPGLAQGQQVVRVRFSFFVAGHHAPYYLGLERGYFSQEGLSVQFGEGRGSVATVRLIGAGQEEIGYADLTSMARAVPEGVPVKALFGVVQRNPIALCFRSSLGIRTPADLRGKSFAMVPGGSQQVLVPAFLAINGMSMADIRAITVLNPTQDFLSGRVDVSQSFQIDFPLEILAKKEGISIDCMRYTDFGLKVINHGFFASRATISRRPDMLRAFFRAVGRSWRATIDDPAAAVTATLKHFPDRDRDLLLLELQNTIRLLHTDHTKDRPIGWMAREDWAETIRILVEYGDLRGRLPVIDYFTNNFVPSP